MADLVSTPIYDPVYQLESVDDVQGGPGGISNRQGQQLANRDDYILQLLQSGIYWKIKDTTSCIANYPTVVALAVAASTLYVVTGNAAVYTLPSVATLTLPAGSVFALTLPGSNRSHLRGIGGDGFDDTISGYGIVTGDLTIYAGQTIILKKPDSGTNWLVLARLNDSYADVGMIVQRHGSPNDNDGWRVCNGSPQLATDWPRLFAKIGYSYGGSGSIFNLPLIAPTTIGGVTVQTYIRA